MPSSAEDPQAAVRRLSIETETPGIVYCTRASQIITDLFVAEDHRGDPARIQHPKNRNTAFPTLPAAANASRF